MKSAEFNVEEGTHASPLLDGRVKRARPLFTLSFEL